MRRYSTVCMMGSALLDRSRSAHVRRDESGERLQRAHDDPEEGIGLDCRDEQDRQQDAAECVLRGSVPSVQHTNKVASIVPLNECCNLTKAVILS